MERPLRHCSPVGTTASFSAPPLAAPTKSGSCHLTLKQSHSSPEQPARPAGCRIQPRCCIGSVGPQWALLACPGHQEGSILNRDRMVPMEQLRQVLKIEGPLFPTPTPPLTHPASQTPLLSACQRAENCTPLGTKAERRHCHSESTQEGVGKGLVSA